MSFKELDLLPELLKALEEEGYTAPTPIQSQAIPIILEGSDLRASAQTGTGKTAAFILPALNILAKKGNTPGKGPRILILVPTRELAMQVANKAVKYSKYLPRMRTVCIYGGAPYPIQNRELSRPYEILVATPGRLIDHMERGRIEFGRLELLVLDEADRMLDMGFIEPVEQIAAATPDSRQTLMFSATLRGPVMTLAKNLLKHPKEINVAAQHEKHENIQQLFYPADNIAHKYKLLDHFLADESINQVIVFTATKRHADELVGQLLDNGHEAAALHGDMNQRQRTRTINDVRQGKVRVLIATDVAARGIDVQTISHVINFDLPMNEEDYVHRIGRTGRAGASGIAISFATPREMSLIRRIEHFTGHKLPPQTVPGLEPKAAPSSGGYKGRSPGGQGRPRFGQRSEGPRQGARGPWKRDARPSREDGPRREDSDSRMERPSEPRTPRFEGERESAPRKPRFEGERESAPRKPRFEGERESAPRKPHFEGERESAPRRPRFEGERESAPRKPRFEGERESAPRKPRFEGERESAPRKPRVDGERHFESRKPRFEGERQSEPRKPRQEGERPSHFNKKPGEDRRPRVEGRSWDKGPDKRRPRSEAGESRGPRSEGSAQSRDRRGEKPSYGQARKPSFGGDKPRFQRGPTKPKPNFGSYAPMKRKKVED